MKRDDLRNEPPKPAPAARCSFAWSASHGGTAADAGRQLIVVVRHPVLRQHLLDRAERPRAVPVAPAVERVLLRERFHEVVRRLVPLHIDAADHFVVLCPMPGNGCREERPVLSKRPGFLPSRRPSSCGSLHLQREELCLSKRSSARAAPPGVLAWWQRQHGAIPGAAAALAILAAAGGDWSTTEETTHVDPDDLFRRLAGRDDLETVTFLEFTVDTAEHSIGDLGVRVPALEQLKLSGSNVATVRDLGLLRNVQVLWLARSGVHDLEGISALPVLRELYAAFNNVSDLSPLMGAEHLQVLDLEGNAIDDPAEVQYPAFCEELRVARPCRQRRRRRRRLPRAGRRRAAAPRALRRRAAPAPDGGADERGGAAGAAAAAAVWRRPPRPRSAPPPPAAGAAALPQCAPTGRGRAPRPPRATRRA